MDTEPTAAQPEPGEPLCAWCHPPRIEDIDPHTTVYYCPTHRVQHDELMRKVADLLVHRQGPPPALRLSGW